MKTIKRSDKAIRIIEGAYNIISYSLENGFLGRSCNPRTFDDKDWLTETYKQLRFAKLQHRGLNRYSLDIHSNQWYEFSSEAK